MKLITLETPLENILFDTLRLANCSLADSQEAVLRYRKQVKKGKAPEIPKTISRRQLLYDEIQRQKHANYPTDKNKI